MKSSVFSFTDVSFGAQGQGQFSFLGLWWKVSLLRKSQGKVKLGKSEGEFWIVKAQHETECETSINQGSPQF